DRQQSAQELSDALRTFVAGAAHRTDLTAEVRRTMLEVFAARYHERMEIEARARALLEDPEAGFDTPLVAIPSFSLPEPDELGAVELISLTPKPEVETIGAPPV